jgi:hypothetical protein
LRILYESIIVHLISLALRKLNSGSTKRLWDLLGTISNPVFKALKVIAKP